MIESKIKEILDVDIFKEGRNEDLFVGAPFHLDYDKANILVADAWKFRAKGLPMGSFLLAFYTGETGVDEALLLRIVTQAKLPTDLEIVSTMIEYYKEGTDIAGRHDNGASSHLDNFTRYELSFSGLECRVLGVFYKLPDMRGPDDVPDPNLKTEFGADIENFYAAHNYRVYKATGKVLRRIVNQRDNSISAGNENEFKIGGSSRNSVES